MTDGAIMDMPETKKALVGLSKLACSVIIIGVGTCNFENMNELDGDGGRLKADNGQECARDIV